MKRKISIFSFILSAGLLSACNSNQAKPGTDSTGHYALTNPYRDTFATTNTYGNANTVDNSGSGGAGIAKSHPVAVSAVAIAPPSPPAPPVAVADSVKK